MSPKSEHCTFAARPGAPCACSYSLYLGVWMHVHVPPAQRDTCRRIHVRACCSNRTQARPHMHTCMRSHVSAQRDRLIDLSSWLLLRNVWESVCPCVGGVSGAQFKVSVCTPVSVCALGMGMWCVRAVHTHTHGGRCGLRIGSSKPLPATC